MQPDPPGTPRHADGGTAGDIKVDYHGDVDFGQELQLRRDFAHSWDGRVTTSTPTHNWSMLLAKPHVPTPFAVVSASPAYLRAGPAARGPGANFEKSTIRGMTSGHLRR